MTGMKLFYSGFGEVPRRTGPAKKENSLFYVFASDRCRVPNLLYRFSKPTAPECTRRSGFFQNVRRVMFPKFIEVHDKDTGLLFSVNIDHIVTFGNTGIILSSVPHDIALGTAETYDELRTMIERTGSLIQKGDPRLDTSRPLTMEDLCRLEMIGQPVWNSNTLKWMLLIDSAPDGRSWVDLVSDSGKTVRMEPHDVRKFPLYRMRKEP